MPFVTPQTQADVEQAARDYGLTPGGKAMMIAEMRAANEAIESGTYITWRSEAGEDCARVGCGSRCLCGHTLAEHKPVDRRNPHAPSCAMCKCRRFEFVPSRPEEVGMGHLPRRKGFVVHAWRAPCRCKHTHTEHDPVTRRCRVCACTCFRSAYACIGCERGQEGHETVFELQAERVASRRPVGAAFRPLHGSELQGEVLALMTRSTSASGSVVESAEPTSLPQGPAGGESIEALFERGCITAAEYHERLLRSPPTAAQSSAAPVPCGGACSRASSTSPPTVASFTTQLPSGAEVAILTNAGPPIPQPGRDWSRPWEPAPAGASRARARAAGPRSGTETAPQGASERAAGETRPRAGGGGGGGGGRVPPSRARSAARAPSPQQGARRR